MRIVLTPQGRADYVEAVDWYAKKGPGLGQRLRADFRAICKRLAINPLQFPAAAMGTRRALLRDFPYAVIFRQSGEVVQIIAFFHTSREPSDWQHRAQ